MTGLLAAAAALVAAGSFLRSVTRHDEQHPDGPLPPAGARNAEAAWVGLTCACTLAAVYLSGWAR